MGCIVAVCACYRAHSWLTACVWVCIYSMSVLVLVDAHAFRRPHAHMHTHSHSIELYTYFWWVIGLLLVHQCTCVCVCMRACECTYTLRYIFWGVSVGHSHTLARHWLLTESTAGPPTGRGRFGATSADEPMFEILFCFFCLEFFCVSGFLCVRYAPRKWNFNRFFWFMKYECKCMFNLNLWFFYSSTFNFIIICSFFFIDENGYYMFTSKLSKECYLLVQDYINNKISQQSLSMQLNK